MSSLRFVELVLLAAPPQAISASDVSASHADQTPSRLPVFLNGSYLLKKSLPTWWARCVPPVDLGAPIARRPNRWSAPPPRTAASRPERPAAAAGSSSRSGRRRDGVAQDSGRARRARASARQTSAEIEM